MQRYTDGSKWDEDWYCDLGGEYQNLWIYICDKCDNAGVWKPNKNDFETKTKFKVNLDSFFKKVNGDKERILLLENGRWFISGFIKYQWFNKKEIFSLNLGNNLHRSLYNIIILNRVNLEKIRGLREVLETSRERGNSNKLVFSNNNPINTNTETSARPLPDLSNPLDEFTPPRSPNAPPLEHVKEFFSGQNKPEKQAIEFFNYYEGLGWRKGISPIFSWRAFANNWISNPININQNGHTTGSGKTPKGNIIPDEKDFGTF